MRTVLIIDLNDTGSETEALRQTLEGFNYFVCVKHIGRPNDFIDVMEGNAPIDPDFVIISCHGDDGKIHMPRLADFVYSDNEPREDFSSAEVERYLKLSQKTIINLGCTTGEENLAKAFSKNNVYIAPCDYIEGTAALFFTLRLFYEMTSKDRNVRSAYMTARETDDETRQFCLFEIRESSSR